MSRMDALRRHWMAIPLGIAFPLMLAVIFIGAGAGWDDGLVGSVVLAIFAVAAAVGSFAAPAEHE
jgi:hypothetical protein